MSPTGRVEPQLELQCGMVSALPVQNQIDDSTFFTHDDLVERCTEDSLTCRGRCGWMRPSAREICAERDQMLALRLAEWQRSSCRDDGDLAFDLMRGCERLVPASLQLAGDKTVGGVDSIVLAACMGCLIASLL